MTWLLEDAFMPMVIGLVSSGAAALGWLQTGSKYLLQAAGVLLILTIAVVVLERMVETDREQIADLLDQIARDIENNDLEAVLGWIHPSDLETRQMAAVEFPRYQFQHVDIKNNLEVEITRDESPREATATFNVVVTASERAGMIRDGRAPFFVTLKLQQLDEDWKVAEYRYESPAVGFMRKR